MLAVFVTGVGNFGELITARSVFLIYMLGLCWENVSRHTLTIIQNADTHLHRLRWYFQQGKLLRSSF